MTRQFVINIIILEGQLFLFSSSHNYHIVIIKKMYDVKVCTRSAFQIKPVSILENVCAFFKLIKLYYC